MTDHADLVERLRRDGIAARDTLKCVEMAPTVDPEDALKAADAIESLQGLVERYESEKDVHEYEQKTLWACVDAQGKRIEELEAALKPFADASDLHLGSDDMSIAFRIIIGNLRQARKALGEEE